MQLFDATAMASAVAKGEVTAEQLVTKAFERMDTSNPALNAVVHTRKEKALQEARTRDFTGLSFGGVPILLKDLGQKQAGEVSTAGSKLFLKARATQSDNFVKRLEEAGFIILGRTNVPEFGFKNITDPAVFGATNLPFDPMRNAGGSSGGAAASVSSGMVPVATASDGGGSIRIPASFNGLIGLKPSRGRIVAGPYTYRSWQGAAVQFALTKSVRDTRNLLKVLQTEQRENPFSLPVLTEAQLSRTVEEPLTIAVTTKSPIGSWVSEHAVEAFEQTVRFLQAQGHDVQVVEWPFDGVELMKSYYMMYSVETAAMFDRIEASLERTMTIDDMELMTWAIYRSGQHIPAKTYTQVLQYWDTVAEVMEQFHQQYDLFLCPTTADVAPYHQDGLLSHQMTQTLQQMDEYSIAEQQSVIWRMYEKSLALTPFTQFANLTGQPAISLPVYQTESGLPLGVQFVAARGREDVLLSIAEQFERAGQLKTK